MCIFADSNAYNIIRNTDIEYNNKQHNKLIQKLKQLQRQYKNETK